MYTNKINYELRAGSYLKHPQNACGYQDKLGCVTRIKNVHLSPIYFQMHYETGT